MLHTHSYSCSLEPSADGVCVVDVDKKAAFDKNIVAETALHKYARWLQLSSFEQQEYGAWDKIPNERSLSDIKDPQERFKAELKQRELKRIMSELSAQLSITTKGNKNIDALKKLAQSVPLPPSLNGGVRFRIHKGMTDEEKQEVRKDRKEYAQREKERHVYENHVVTTVTFGDEKQWKNVSLSQKLVDRFVF